MVFPVLHQDSYTSNYDTIGSMELHDTGNLGGVVVNTSDKTIRIFGSTRVMYRLSSSLQISKYTRVELDAVKSSTGLNVLMCLYEESSPSYDVSRCMDLDDGNNILEVGKVMYNSRMVNIKYIAFQQISADKRDGESIIRNLSFLQLSIEPIFNSSGNCRDSNAIKVNSTTCLCKLGFVASNGGKIIGKYDSCIKCIGIPICGFDGDTCISDDECYLGYCSDGSCLSKVRSYDWY